MRYLPQFAIIFSVTCAGELLHALLPLPIPASIYGLILLILLLTTKRIHLEQVKDAATFLVDIMPLMFIPAGVGISTSWGILRRFLIPFCVIVILTTFLVMIVTGKVADFFINRRSGNE